MRERRVVFGVLGLVAALLVVSVTLAITRNGSGVNWGSWWPGAAPPCVATGGEREVELELEQAQAAGLVAGTAVGDGLPARAATVALTVALTDHDLTDLPGGSRAWAEDFYAALPQGYRNQPIALAAAAAPAGAGSSAAYAENTADAQVLAFALTGLAKQAITCEIDDDAPPGSDELNPIGLVPRAAAVRRDVLRTFGELPTGGFAPGGVSSGHKSDSAHYSGRAVDIFFRPINPANKRHGWAVAQYLLTQADRLEIATLIFDDRIWTASRSDEGWRDYDAPVRPGAQAILEHRDHVHADVFE